MKFPRYTDLECTAFQNFSFDKGLNKTGNKRNSLGMTPTARTIAFGSLKRKFANESLIRILLKEGQNSELSNN